MSIYISNNANNLYPEYYNNFQGNQNNSDVRNFVQKPIDKVENIFNKTYNNFVKPPEDDEKKKSHKKAITVGSTVLVLSAITAMLNPRFSSKFVGKLKNLSEKAEVNLKKNKNNFLKTKFYQTTINVAKGAANFAQFTNTINATKDVSFKWLCSADKFNNVQNPTAKKVLKKCNSGFTNVMTKANNSITSWFDDVSKSTVSRTFKNANKNLNFLDDTINAYKNKLNPVERKKIDDLLKEIVENKKYFSEQELTNRFANQEKVMGNIEHDFKDKLINGYFKKFKGWNSKGSFKDKYDYDMKLIKDNLSYWAEDMLMPERNKLEKQGIDAIEKLVGNSKNAKGKYQEVFDIISPHLNDEEKKLFQNTINETSKKLNLANKRECVEYFDKKRDLMLGGAPTDILTGVVTLGASGIAISNADSKHERTSRALTMGFPAVAGIGTSIAMTAMLFSGFQGLAIGGITSVILSRIGSFADKYLNPPPVDSTIKKTEILNDTDKPKEILYA